MGAERFTEPFCFDTLQRLAVRPFNRLFRQQSDLTVLRERACSHPGLPMQGMVFHMSRCGSTLAAQWLAALPDSVVLSEPEPVDAVLQWPASEHGDTGTLRALLCALGQPRREGDRSLFLKTDCWHMVHFARLLEAFPGVPWVFLYRNPVEVLASHQEVPGWQLVPGSMKGHGLQAPEEVMNNPLGHGAWIMSVILEEARLAMSRHANGLLVNYSELPQALETRIAAHFGIARDVLDGEELQAVTGRHAKQPNAAFRPDAAQRRANADKEVLSLAEYWLDTPYRRLEEMRLGAGGYQTMRS
jgi:hypothetical protein